MKKKNLIIIAISLLIIILTVIIGYKVYNFRKFSFDNYRYERLKDFTDKFSVKGTIEFKNANLKKDYLEYKNIKIKNDYADFIKEDGKEFNSYEHDATYKKMDGDRTVVLFDFGIENYTIKGLMSYMKAFSVDASDKDNIKRETPVDIEDLFTEYNIKDDYDLIKYGYEHKDDKLNALLDSVKLRKQRTYVYANLNMFLGAVQDIYLVKGDLKGYMTVTKNDTVTKIILRLIKDDNNAYFFSWNYDNDFYTSEDIENFLNSIQIG